MISLSGQGALIARGHRDEQLAYEQSHGLGHVTYSLDEFLADLESDEQSGCRRLTVSRCSSACLSDSLPPVAAVLVCLRCGASRAETLSRGRAIDA